MIIGTIRAVFSDFEKQSVAKDLFKIVVSKGDDTRLLTIFKILFRNVEM